MFGFNGTNDKSYWGAHNQEWLNARSGLKNNPNSSYSFNGNTYSSISDLDRAYLAWNPNAGFVDLNGDGRAELPPTAGAAKTVSFSFLKALQAKGVDTVLSSSDIVIDISQQANDGNNYSLKSVVNFLKSTKLNFTKADGSVAKLSVDADQPVALAFADIDALSKKGVSLVDANGIGLISLAATQADLIAGFKTISITQSAAMQQTGVSVVNVVDSKKLILTVDQAKAIAVGGLTFSSNSYVAIVDTAANISLLSAAQISALGAMGLKQIDASDGDTKEIVFTDRQIRALTRADIIVAAEDKLRAKITDDYVLKALTDPDANFGKVLEDLAAVGVDTVSGTTEGLKLTAKMLSDGFSMFNTSANKFGLIKVADKAGAVSDTKPLTGLIISYESDSELTFLPAPKADLEALGAKFVKADVKTFGIAGTAANSIKPTIEIAVGKDLVIKPEKFLTQKDAKGTADVAITDLSLVSDTAQFKFVLKVREASASDSNAVDLNSTDFYFSRLSNPNSMGYNEDYNGDGVSEVWQWNDWALKPFQRDFTRDVPGDGNEPSLPRFTLKLTSGLKDLIKEANGAPLTITMDNGKTFDVDVDRGWMDYVNSSYDWVTKAADGTDQGDFVVLRVLDDAKFEAAVSTLGALPYDTGQGRSYFDWVDSFLDQARVSTNSIKASEVFTITLDDEEVPIDPSNNEYVVNLTGAQLKAGALVITPNYGAVDSNGKSMVDRISFTGGQGEKTVFSLSSAVNGVNWWNKAAPTTVTGFGSYTDAWSYAQVNGGSVNFDNNGYSVLVSQRDLVMTVGDIFGKGDPDQSFTFRLPSWVSDSYSAANQLSSILNGGEQWMVTSLNPSQTPEDKANSLWNANQWWYQERGVTKDELVSLLKLSSAVTFSDDGGRLIANYKNPGDVKLNMLAFTEANAAGVDQDGVDVVTSDLYTATKTKKFVAASANGKLSVGDKLTFSVKAGSTAAAATEKASFTIEITEKMVTDAKGDSTTLLLNAIKAAVSADLKTGSGNTAVTWLKPAGITKVANGDAVQFVFESNKVNNVIQDVSLSITTVKEAGTLLVQQSSQDGSGGTVVWQSTNSTDAVTVANFNQAPKVSSSGNAQELAAIFGATTVSLSSINVVDDSSDLLIAVSPSRGVYSGTFTYFDSSLVAKFIAKGDLKVTYIGSDGKSAPLPDKVPAGVGKIFIEAHQSVVSVGGDNVTYKASDLVNMVLASTSFQINRTLFTEEKVATISFDLSINDTYTSDTKGVKTFAKDGERMVVGSVQHSSIGDETNDGRIDTNDTVVKVSTLRQFALDSDTNTGLDTGLHRTDSVTTGQSPGINDDLSHAKLFTITNKTLAHQFNRDLADMIVEKQLGSTSAIFLHTDEELGYSLDQYAKAGFAAVYNESTDVFMLSASMANTLSRLGTSIIGDAEISFDPNNVAETLKIPFTSLTALQQWKAPSFTSGDGDAAVAEYAITNLGDGDKIDLTALVAKANLTFITADPSNALVNTTLSGTQWFAFNDTANQQVHVYVGDVNAATSAGSDGSITLKAQFDIDVAGLNKQLTETEAKALFV